MWPLNHSLAEKAVACAERCALHLVRVSRVSIGLSGRPTGPNGDDRVWVLWRVPAM